MRGYVISHIMSLDKSLIPHSFNHLPFGEVVRSRRKALGMSMTDLGNKVDIDQGNLSLIETGKRRPPETFYAERMAEALGIPSSRTVFKSFLQRAEVERHSGQGAPILRKDQLSKLLPPYKDWVLLSEAGRVDDLVLQVVSEIGAPNFYDLEYPLGPSIDVRGQTKLLAGPNLVVWNRMGDKFADLISEFDETEVAVCPLLPRLGLHAPAPADRQAPVHIQLYPAPQPSDLSSPQTNRGDANPGTQQSIRRGRPSAMNEETRNALDYLTALTHQQFWGFVSLKFEKGRVVHVRREREPQAA